MIHNRLMINDDKTKFLLIGTRQQLDKLDSCSITVGDNRITPSPCVRNLRSWSDSNLSMTDHINKACNAAFYHLHNLRRIKKYLSRDSLITLVHAFITSRLDYCNGLLFGLPKAQIAKLQRAQNAAARLILGIGKFSHNSLMCRSQPCKNFSGCGSSCYTGALRAALAAGFFAY